MMTYKRLVAWSQIREIPEGFSWDTRQKCWRKWVCLFVIPYCLPITTSSDLTDWLTLSHTQFLSGRQHFYRLFLKKEWRATTLVLHLEWRSSASRLHTPWWLDGVKLDFLRFHGEWTQWSSKHALAPTDPLQVEIDSSRLGRSERKANSMCCWWAQSLLGSFGCIHHNREQHRKLSWCSLSKSNWLISLCCSRLTTTTKLFWDGVQSSTFVLLFLGFMNHLHTEKPVFLFLFFLTIRHTFITY